MKALVVTAVLALGLIALPAAENSQLVPFQKAQLSTTELLALTGIDAYKFKLDLPKGQQFRVSLRRLSLRGVPEKTLFQFDFMKTQEGPADFVVSFLPRDRKMAGVLLSEDQEAELRIQSEGCSPPGAVTIVENPLAGIKDKGLFVCASSVDSFAKSQDGVRLILLTVRGENEPQRGLPTTPGAELIVTKLP